MAILFPDLAKISELKVPPTEGELYLLNHLNEHLDDSFEVYFQPMLDGDRPDIVIMKKHAGILIIEVKDWNFDAYTINKNEDTGAVTWRIAQSNTEILSPITQVRKYKTHIYQFHLEGAYQKAATYQNGQNQYSFVTCCVYFHNANQNEVSHLASLYKNKYLGLLSKDGLSKQLTTLLRNTNFDQYSSENPSFYFTDSYYEQLRRILMPSFHELNIGKKCHYTKKQYDLIKSESGNKKIKGASGSGKSTILAQRAVNSYKRTAGLYERAHDEILILTYNITLINFLKDKINDVRDDFPRKNFYIDNFHNFIGKACNNLEIESPWIIENNVLTLKLSFEDELIQLRERIIPYSAIFIDEIQDFPREWQRIIKNYFLIPNGEFVIFGDEKQNIYGNELEEKKIATIIPSRWNELNETHRLTIKLTNLALSFQKEFFGNKYNIDPIEVKTDAYGQINLNISDEETLKYYYYDSKKDFFDQQIIEKVFSDISKSPYPHPNDIAILSSEKEILRDIDYTIRKKKNLQTATTFADKRVYDRLVCKHKKNHSDNIDRTIHSKEFKEELRIIERNKKLHFRMNPGTIKLSTIHSFKGWEIYNLILLITKSNPQTNESSSIDELIYTGLTRCRNNLIVINIENPHYHQFFQSQMPSFDHSQSTYM